MSDKTRTEFEAWAAEHGTRNFSRDEATGMYCILIVEGKWKAWLASRNSTLEEVARVCDRNVDGTKTGGSFAGGMRSMAQHLAKSFRSAAAESRQGGET